MIPQVPPEKYSVREKALAPGSVVPLKNRPRRKDRLLTQEDQTTPANSCDAELVARAQRGEEEAFESLFHAHKRRVYHLCLKMIGNAAEAEELTQEAFLQAFRKIHTFRAEAAFSTWLHRISFNIVLMRLRKRRTHEVLVESSDEDEESARPQEEFGAPDLALTSVVDRLCLKRAVAQLPPGCRRVFVLHDVLGCKHHEIAAAMGCSIGNSKSQLHQARMRLRKLMGAAKNGPSGETANRVTSMQSPDDPSLMCKGEPDSFVEVAAVSEEDL